MSFFKGGAGTRWKERIGSSDWKDQVQGDCVFSVVLGDPTSFSKEDGHKTEATLSPFWTVGITHDEQEANMVMKDHRPD